MHDQFSARRVTPTDENDQDRLEREFHAIYVAYLEERRRAFELCAYRCPDHGCDLVECEDVDEQGVHVYYQCPAADHAFGSIHDPAGGYAPVDDEIRALAIDVAEELRP